MLTHSNQLMNALFIFVLILMSLFAVSGGAYMLRQEKLFPTPKDLEVSAPETVPTSAEDDSIPREAFDEINRKYRERIGELREEIDGLTQTADANEKKLLSMQSGKEICVHLQEDARKLEQDRLLLQTTRSNAINQLIEMIETRIINAPRLIPSFDPETLRDAIVQHVSEENRKQHFDTIASYPENLYRIVETEIEQNNITMNELREELLRVRDTNYNVDSHDELRGRVEHAVEAFDNTVVSELFFYAKLSEDIEIHLTPLFPIIPDFASKANNDTLQDFVDVASHYETLRGYTHTAISNMIDTMRARDIPYEHCLNNQEIEDLDEERIHEVFDCAIRAIVSHSLSSSSSNTMQDLEDAIREGKLENKNRVKRMKEIKAELTDAVSDQQRTLSRLDSTRRLQNDKTLDSSQRDRLRSMYTEDFRKVEMQLLQQRNDSILLQQEYEDMLNQNKLLLKQSAQRKRAVQSMESEWNKYTTEVQRLQNQISAAKQYTDTLRESGSLPKQLLPEFEAVLENTTTTDQAIDEFEKKQRELQRELHRVQETSRPTSFSINAARNTLQRIDEEESQLRKKNHQLNTERGTVIKQMNLIDNNLKEMHENYEKYIVSETETPKTTTGPKKRVSFEIPRVFSASAFASVDAAVEKVMREFEIPPTNTNDEAPSEDLGVAKHLRRIRERYADAFEKGAFRLEEFPTDEDPNRIVVFVAYLDLASKKIRVDRPRSSQADNLAPIARLAIQDTPTTEAGWYQPTFDSNLRVAVRELQDRVLFSNSNESLSQQGGSSSGNNAYVQTRVIPLGVLKLLRYRFYRKHKSNSKRYVMDACVSTLVFLLLLGGRAVDFAFAFLWDTTMSLGTIMWTNDPRFAAVPYFVAYDVFQS